jgi:hypothetical protein
MKQMAAICGGSATTGSNRSLTNANCGDICTTSWADDYYNDPKKGKQLYYHSWDMKVTQLPCPNVDSYDSDDFSSEMTFVAGTNLDINQLVV